MQSSRLESFYREALDAIHMHSGGLEKLEKVLKEYKEFDVNTRHPSHPSLLKSTLAIYNARPKIDIAIYLLEHGALPDLDADETAFAYLMERLHEGHGIWPCMVEETPRLFVKLALLFIRKDANILHPSVKLYQYYPKRSMCRLADFILNLQTFYTSENKSLISKIAQQLCELGDEEQALAWYEKGGYVTEYVYLRIRRGEFHQAIEGLKRFADKYTMTSEQIIGLCCDIGFTHLGSFSDAMKLLHSVVEKTKPSDEFTKSLEIFLAQEEKANECFEAKTPQLPPLLHLVRNLAIHAPQSSTEARRLLKIMSERGPHEVKALAVQFLSPDELKAGQKQQQVLSADYFKAMRVLYASLDTKREGTDVKADEAHWLFESSRKASPQGQLRYTASLIPVSQVRALDEYQNLIERKELATLDYYSLGEIPNQLMALSKIAEGKNKFYAIFVLSQFVCRVDPMQLGISVSKFAKYLEGKKEELMNHCAGAMRDALVKGHDAILILLRRMLWSYHGINRKQYKEIVLPVFSKYKDGSATPEMLSLLRRFASELSQYKQNPAFTREVYQILEQYYKDDETFLQEAAEACNDQAELEKNAADYKTRSEFIAQLKQKLKSCDVRVAKFICNYFNEYLTGPACPYDRETSPIAEQVFDLLKQHIKWALSNEHSFSFVYLQVLELSQSMKQRLIAYTEEMLRSKQKKGVWATESLIEFYKSKEEKAKTTEIRTKLIDCYETMACVEVKRQVDTREHYINALTAFAQDESKELKGTHDHAVCALGRSLIKNNRVADAASLYYLPALKIQAEYRLADYEGLFTTHKYRQAGLVCIAFLLLLTDPIEKVTSRHEMKDQQEIQTFRDTLKVFLVKQTKSKNYAAFSAFLKQICDDKPKDFHILNPYHYILVCISSLRQPESTTMLNLFETGVRELFELKHEADWQTWKKRQLGCNLIEQVQGLHPETNPDGIKQNPADFPVPHDVVEEKADVTTQMEQPALQQQTDVSRPPETNPDGVQQNPDDFPVPHDVVEGNADVTIQMEKPAQQQQSDVSPADFSVRHDLVEVKVEAPEGVPQPSSALVLEQREHEPPKRKVNKDIEEDVVEGLDQKAEPLPTAIQFVSTDMHGEKVVLDIPANFFKLLHKTKQGHFSLPPAILALAELTEDFDIEPGANPLMPDG